jgi:hypothetical protein
MDDGVGSDDSAAADDSVGSDDTGSTEPDTQPTLGPNADDTPLDEPDAQSPTSEASDASTSGSSSSMTDTVSSSEPLDGGAGDGPSLTSGSDGGLCSALGLPGCTVTDPVTELPDATLPDECPDVDQSLRGSCGCGFEPSPLCEELAQGLVHRYSFDGTGTTVVDSVGDADGFTVDVELDGSGELDLDGQSAHAQLPAGISSEFQDATFEAWVTWYGGDNNQRILNFGTPDPSDGAPLEYISLTPSSGNTPGLTFAYRTDPDISGISLRAPDPLPESTMQHVTVAFDGSGGTVRLYQGSELLISDTTTDNLQSLADEVNYLGRALYSGYPFLQARIYEFRIYGVALSTEQVQKSDELGPDATISF